MGCSSFISIEEWLISIHGLATAGDVFNGMTGEDHFALMALGIAVELD